jgi:uncharacterized repeat protein (TIGR01451 family)
VTITPLANQNGTATIDITVSDGELSTTASFTLTVSSVNDVPLLDALIDQEVDEGQDVTLTLTASDPYDSPQNHLTYAVSGLPQGAQYQLNAQTGEFVWHTSEADGPGRYPLTFTVRDDGQPPAETTQQAVITINALNDLQLTANSALEPVLAGNFLNYQFTIANPNPDAADGLILTTILPNGLSFDPATSSPACHSLNQQITCTPGETISAQGQLQLVIAAEVPANTPANTQFSFSASASAAQSDPDSSNNTVTLSSSVVTEMTVNPVDGTWSDTDSETSPCGNLTFLGEFSNQTVSLTLPDVPAHQRVEVTFDLLILRSWDGSETQARQGMEALGMPFAANIGPDIWQFRMNDKDILTTTFSNWDTLTFRQAYPGTYPGSDFPARSGSVANNQYCYTYSGTPMDALYHMSFTIEDTDPTLTLDFLAQGLQSIADESWGLANVTVKLMAQTNPVPKLFFYLPQIMK